MTEIEVLREQVQTVNKKLDIIMGHFHINNKKTVFEINKEADKAVEKFRLKNGSKIK